MDQRDIYPQPGHRIALAVPLSGQYAIARYEEARNISDDRDGLSSLADMQLAAAGHRHRTEGPPLSVAYKPLTGSPQALPADTDNRPHQADPGHRRGRRL